jgi:ubiquitin C-terminal hydrolase
VAKNEGLRDQPSRTFFSMLTRSASSIAAINGSISGRSIRSINWRTKGEQWWTAHRKKENSIIRVLFEGVLRSIMTCDTCGGISGRFETFSQLILPLSDSRKSKFSLNELIGELFHTESIDGIDCDYCKRKRIFSRTTDVWRLPPYLIITVARFSYDYSARKINTAVEYPETLSLEHLVSAEAPLQRTADYELYGVIEHEGTLNRGHYTSCASVGGQWHFINDSRATKIDKSAAFGRNAYMLFYKWREIDSMELD